MRPNCNILGKVWIWISQKTPNQYETWWQLYFMDWAEYRAETPLETGMVQINEYWPSQSPGWNSTEIMTYDFTDFLHPICLSLSCSAKKNVQTFQSLDKIILKIVSKKGSVESVDSRALKTNADSFHFTITQYHVFMHYIKSWLNTSEFKTATWQSSAKVNSFSKTL